MTQNLLCVFACSVMLAAAAVPPGTVNANGPFKLNGTAVPATAAASTPYNLGDRLATGDNPAVLRLDPYNAIITVAPHSSITSGESKGQPFVRLQSGSLEYKLTAASKLLIFKTSQPVVTSLAGVVTIVSHTTPIIVVASAGAAAIITTVALVTRSPSQPAPAANR